MDPLMAQIIMFGGNFAPRGWALCNGQLLSIAQNQALFSILGTIYGGDGRTTFALPDLRGRVPVHPGQAPGSSVSVQQGQTGGNSTNILTVGQLPAHGHAASTQAANPVGRGEGTTDPTGAYLAEGGAYATVNNVKMASDQVTVGLTGSGEPVNNMQPYQGVNYIISLQGVYPSRN